VTAHDEVALPIRGRRPVPFPDRDENIATHSRKEVSCLFSPLSVDVDVSQAEHVVCAMTAEGQVRARVRVPNDRPGIEQLIQWMETHAAEFDRLAVGLKSTSVYHWPLFAALAQAESLQRWRPQWFLMNPSIVQGFRKTYVDRAKTDPGDALLMADTIRLRLLRQAPAPDPRYTVWRVVTRHRFHRAQTVSREKRRALNELFCLGGGSGRPPQIAIKPCSPMSLVARRNAC
jgi:transposase